MGPHFAEENVWRDRFFAVPFDNNGGQWGLRYYQYNAVRNVLEAIARGEQRILLTMATGTGEIAPKSVTVHGGGQDQFRFVVNPSTVPAETAPLARNQLSSRGRWARSVRAISGFGV